MIQNNLPFLRQVIINALHPNVHINGQERSLAETKIFSCVTVICCCFRTFVLSSIMTFTFSLHMFLQALMSHLNISESGEISCIYYIWSRMNQRRKQNPIFRPFNFPPAYFPPNILAAPTDWCALDRLQMFWERRPDYKERRQIPCLQLNLVVSAAEQMWSSLRLMEMVHACPTKANKTFFWVHELLALKEMHSRKQELPLCTESSVAYIELG